MKTGSMNKDSKNVAFKFTVEHFFLLFFLLVIGFFVFVTVTSPVAWNICQRKKVFALILGCDATEYSRRADTIILMCYDPAAQYIKLLSIPRDTNVEFLDTKAKKINELYAFAYKKKKDPDYACVELKKRIEAFILPEQKIPFYLQIDYSGFIKLLDLLDGVRIRINEPMNYDDNWGNLHIHFSTGIYLLSGKHALEYVRYRDKNGDTGRILRQQSFLKDLIEQKLRNPLTIYKLPSLFKAILDNLHTNLSFWDIFYLGIGLKNLPARNVHSLQLPGSIKGSYWIPDRERIMLLEALLSSSPQDNETDTNNLVTAEVWNGTRESGLALHMIRRLRRYNVDVRKWGNWGTIVKNTRVIDRTGNLRHAQKVAACFTDPDVISSLEPTRMVDVTIVLGEDCLSLIDTERKHGNTFINSMGVK